METLIAGYAEACRQHYAPFFRAQPHILENYLVNAIFRRQFPFGPKDGHIVAEPETAREFALLATQFALVKGLLIGVAGFHKEQFSAAHVIHTVQAASKHFDHHPQFLDEAHALLVSTGRDNAHGLTMLLRN
jgi:lysine-N-methylase